MKTLLVLVSGFLLLANFALAEGPAAGSDVSTLTGVVVDNACATGNKANIGEFVKTHTLDCALMPGCEASGYSLYTADGKLTAFTKASNAKVAKFLKSKKGTLNVEVKIKKSGTQFELISIKHVV
jgi:hypothetical protein